MFALTTWHFFLLPQLCDNLSPLELRSQGFACLPRSHHPVFPTTPTACALGQMPVFFPGTLKPTLPSATHSSHCYIPFSFLLDTYYVSRSTEGIWKYIGVVPLVLQSLHRDFSILTRCSATGNCATFFIAADIQGEASVSVWGLLFHIVFFSVRIRSVFNVQTVAEKCYKYIRFCL